MKRYKHRGLSKTQIYQQVYVLCRNPISCWYIDVLAATVYSVMTDLYHDTNPIYRGYS